MSRAELLTGNEAAARAVRLSKPQVIPTYPITPQSPMLESIARDVETGLLKAEFVNMESDYAAMAAAVGVHAETSGRARQQALRALETAAQAVAELRR